MQFMSKRNFYFETEEYQLSEVLGYDVVCWNLSQIYLLEYAM
jgi:hypothetical protein